MARELNVVGLMNVQFAVKREEGRPSVFVLEVNPRASRTVPFVSKATNMPLAKAAAKVMAGMSLAEQGYTREPVPAHVSVKEAVFPFAKFAGVDVVLSPEMKSTGEVMGVSERFSMAFAKSQMAAGSILPSQAARYLSALPTVRNDMSSAWPPGWNGSATNWSPHAARQQLLKLSGIKVQEIKKLQQGHPNLLDLLDRRRYSACNEHTQRQRRADRRRPHPRRHGRPPDTLHHHHPSRRRGGSGHGSAT